MYHVKLQDWKLKLSGSSDLKVVVACAHSYTQSLRLPFFLTSDQEIHLPIPGQSWFRGARPLSSRLCLCERRLAGLTQLAPDTNKRRWGVRQFIPLIDLIPNYPLSLNPTQVISQFCLLIILLRMLRYFREEWKCVWRRFRSGCPRQHNWLKTLLRFP